MEDLLSWDVPFDHLEAPQGLASRVEAVEKEGVRAWRVLFFQRPSDGAKEGPAVLGARVLPEPPGLPPLTLEGSTLAFAGWRLALLGLPHGLLLPAYRPLLDGAPYPALGLTFPLGGARGYGLGERARGLERRGGRYWNLTADRFPRPGQDPLYQAHPLILCLRGARALGLLLDESAPSLFLGFSHPGEGRVLALAPRLDLYLLEGEVLEVVRGLTLLTGCPLMLPSGLWATTKAATAIWTRRPSRRCSAASRRRTSPWRASGWTSTTARRRGSGGRCAAPLTESASTSFWKSLGKGSWPRSWGCPGPFESGEASGGRGGFFWTWEKGKPGPAGPEMRLSQKARHQGHSGLQDGL